MMMMVKEMNNIMMLASKTRQLLLSNDKFDKELVLTDTFIRYLHTAFFEIVGIITIFHTGK